jgi:GxxExxY protein
MDANERECLDSVAERTIGAIYEVANVLGAGFLEKVYQRALVNELMRRGIRALPQVAFPVQYKGDSVGEYFADIIVEDRLVVEIKCVDHFSGEHTAQCINYLKASGLKLALLVNFQKPKVEWRRVVHNL